MVSVNEGTAQAVKQQKTDLVARVASLVCRANCNSPYLSLTLEQNLLDVKTVHIGADKLPPIRAGETIRVPYQGNSILGREHIAYAVTSIEVVEQTAAGVRVLERYQLR
ncbi:hypothetical protein HYU40_02540 [Candidatus Woesearchaeota archaeon]|nr:hypothetical protein [Candidatus Woesearchaeota archaeon]